MKKILLSLLLTCFLCATQTVCFADSTTPDISIEYLDDGSYYLTIISDSANQSKKSPVLTASTQSTNTVTKSKTVYYKNASGQTIKSDIATIVTLFYTLVFSVSSQTVL